MPFILLPPLGGISGGDMCYTSLKDQFQKRRTTHAPPLEIYIDRSVRNHKEKF